MLHGRRSNGMRRPCDRLILLGGFHQDSDPITIHPPGCTLANPIVPSRRSAERMPSSRIRPMTVRYCSANVSQSDAGGLPIALTAMEADHSRLRGGTDAQAASHVPFA
jgi:hypothetical protein